MKSFRQYIQEAGGQIGGQVELVKTSPEKARAYAEKVMAQNNRSLDDELPNFDKNYALMLSRAKQHGQTQRIDMPVIDATQVKHLQKTLQKGHIDVSKPFGDTTDKKNLFPPFLKGTEAAKFLEGGKKKHDGDKKDDRIDAEVKKVKVSSLKPIQRQIYVDKAVDKIALKGMDKYGKKLKETIIITNHEGFIIDGHHRYFRAMLVDPEMKINALVIKMPIKNLLSLSLAYADARGNERNS